MATKVTALTTEHLGLMREEMQLMRKDIAEFRSDITKQMMNQFAEIKQRYRVQEHQIMGLKRDEVAASEDVTALRHQIDGLIERLQRLEDRAAH